MIIDLPAMAFLNFINYTMNVKETKITIGGKEYHCIDTFKKMNQLKENKSVYNWVDKGKAEKKKMFNKSFFRLSD